MPRTRANANESSNETIKENDETTSAMKEYEDSDDTSPRDASSIRRYSRQLSRTVSQQLLRRRSSVIESLPETPAGWAVLLSAVASAVLGYEIRLRDSLTAPPIVFGQCCSPTGNPQLKRIYDLLTQDPQYSILSRKIQPSLFVGTRGIIASTAAYVMLGPPRHTHIRFREILTMSQDGARVALDWELPSLDCSGSPQATDEQRKQAVLHGRNIQQPVVLILHGINNDASFGYVRACMRTCTDRGWIAVGMNFRGCGGVPLATPRGYTGGYTGDLRSIVHTLSGRLQPDVPLFLVGNSLGANILTKYMGEEGFSGTLPQCVAGAISLGNPLQINSGNMHAPWGQLLAAGAKRGLLMNYKALSKMSDPVSRKALRGALLASDIGDFDRAASAIYIRNEPDYPFSVQVGYENGEAYWWDASSYRYVGHISVPFLQIIAGDDFLVSRPSTSKLRHALMNPNIIAVETRCGGHLGWQESPPDSDSRPLGMGTSWADTATAEFIDAVIHTRQDNNMRSQSSTNASEPQYRVEAPLDSAPRLQSRL